MDGTRYPRPATACPRKAPNPWRPSLQLHLRSHPGVHPLPRPRIPIALALRRDIFWTYEDPLSISRKARYALEKQLGGLMIWELGEDNVDSDLLHAAHSSLRSVETSAGGITSTIFTNSPTHFRPLPRPHDKLNTAWFSPSSASSSQTWSILKPSSVYAAISAVARGADVSLDSPLPPAPSIFPSSPAPPPPPASSSSPTTKPPKPFKPPSSPPAN